MGYTNYSRRFHPCHGLPEGNVSSPRFRAAVMNQYDMACVVALGVGLQFSAFLGLVLGLYVRLAGP